MMMKDKLIRLPFRLVLGFGRGQSPVSLGFSLVLCVFPVALQKPRVRMGAVEQQKLQ